MSSLFVTSVSVPISQCNNVNVTMAFHCTVYYNLHTAVCVHGCHFSFHWPSRGSRYKQTGFMTQTCFGPLDNSQRIIIICKSVSVKMYKKAVIYYFVVSFNNMFTTNPRVHDMFGNGKGIILNIICYSNSLWMIHLSNLAKCCSWRPLYLQSSEPFCLQTTWQSIMIIHGLSTFFLVLPGHS